MNLIQLSIKRPVLVTMMMVALVGLGLFCYLQLPQEMFPKVDFPIVTVVTRYEGAGPDEIEELITKKIEDQISEVEGIKHINSISQQGLSLVMAEFYLSQDVDVAAADIRAKVDLVREALPEEADDPITQKFDFNAQPVMLVSVSAPRSLREVYFTADEKVKTQLATIPDVSSVELVGGEEREIHILTNQQRLRSYGLSITDIISAIARANLETPGGYIRQNSREYNIRLRGKFANLDKIRNMRVRVHDNRTIYLRDIAEIRDTYKEIRDKARADRKACVGITIKKRADGNIIGVDKAVRNKLAALKQILPKDYDFGIQYEQASWIKSSLQNVFSNMEIGIILTAIALFVFLHSFRSMFIVSLTMPISVLATFIVMYISGFTLNLMSLMGLAMTVGVLVNNAILVLENITRYLHLGHEPRLAASEGTSEIAVAVASTTLTNVVVFVPIAFMGGIVGQFFKDLGLTATFATIISLFISFTLAPMMASRLLTRENTGVSGTGILARFARGFDRNLQALKQAYSGALTWCLHHRIITLLIVFVLLAGSVGLVFTGYIGAEFITNMDQGKFAITVEMPTGTRLEETDAAVHKIEDVLWDPCNLPELTGTYATIGTVSGGKIGGASQAVNIAQINVNLVDKFHRRESSSQIMNRMRPILAAADIPGAHIKLLEISGGGGGSEAAIQMQVIGDDMDQLKEFADKALAIIKQKVAGVVDLDTNFRLGQPEIRIIPDKDKCRQYNLDTRYISQVVLASFEGIKVSEYREGAYDYDIRVRGDINSRRQISDVQNLTVITPTGELVPLPEVARIEHTLGPSQLFRKDRQSQITISCDTAGRSSGAVAGDIKKLMLAQLGQYPGIHIDFAGEIERMQESFQRMIVALIMAISLTYLLLASLLESFTQPLIIMFSLPLSLIGVLTALFLMGGTFSIFSIMSIIMLVGLVINNSIVVIDYINILRERGVDRFSAIIESGTTRLRPILMANLTTVVALIPLAMGLGWGGEMRAPMAMVQIGGLIAGGWLGLLVVPVIYTLSDDFNNFVLRLLHLKKDHDK